MSYQDFLDRKSQSESLGGFAPVYRPDYLYDFQGALLDWVVRIGRGAVLADCGLGKTPMQLATAQNVVEHTNRRVLLLTPLAVGAQAMAEAQKFGIPCVRSRDGALPEGATIVIANYEQLHRFSPSDFAGVVCDESSILKHFTGATQKAVTRFMAKVPYRSLWTATAAPNDYIELGSAAEALGALGYSDMLGRFFAQNELKTCRREEVKMSQAKRDMRARPGDEAAANRFAKLSFRVSQQMNQYRLKGHAEQAFWRWVCSWARACRKPSDLGFDDARFVLPDLIERDHTIEPRRPADGMLFTVPAFGLGEEREERRRTMTERCETVAALVTAHQDAAVIWCHLNAEGDRLAAEIPNSRQVRGADSDEAKEEAYLAFASGQLTRLIIKPKIGSFGLNWQHCNHVVTFASHSYEQYYQSVRRCWRFGQTRPVTVDIVSTTGEAHVRENMRRKAEQAGTMFAALVQHMNQALGVRRGVDHSLSLELPSWVSSSKPSPTATPSITATASM